jgi:hypothetical protein
VGQRLSKLKAFQLPIATMQSNQFPGARVFIVHNEAIICSNFFQLPKTSA